jgi:hypothetical protein
MFQVNTPKDEILKSSVAKKLRNVSYTSGVPSFPKAFWSHCHLVRTRLVRTAVDLGVVGGLQAAAEGGQAQLGLAGGAPEAPLVVELGGIL